VCGKSNRRGCLTGFSVEFMNQTKAKGQCISRPEISPTMFRLSDRTCGRFVSLGGPQMRLTFYRSPILSFCLAALSLTAHRNPRAIASSALESACLHVANGDSRHRRRDFDGGARLACSFGGCVFEPTLSDSYLGKLAKVRKSILVSGTWR
jgi:hypothetical protein